MKIKTGATALYKQKIISYPPAREHIEMLFGTNTTKYDHKKYQISLQKEETLKLGVIEIQGESYYRPERLFIELQKFKLENTVRNDAYRELTKIIDPNLTKKIYEEIKGKRRNLNNEEIESFLNKHLLYIEEKLKEPNNDKETILREYIMALVSKNDVPICLIKGGSSIELFTKINRATQDVDTHTAKSSIPEVIDSLCDKNRDVYFKLSLDDKEILDRIKNEEEIEKKIYQFKMFPISKGGVLHNELKSIHPIKICFNTTYKDNEIKEMIRDYGITKKKLKHLENATCLIFTREMLLAEKFQSLISKPESSTRTKDLIDLKLLWSNDINFNHFRKWLFRKWLNQKKSLKECDAKKEIEKNKNRKLEKIHDNFDDAIKMYDLEISYEECIVIYNRLIEEALK